MIFSPPINYRNNSGEATSRAHIGYFTSLRSPRLRVNYPAAELRGIKIQNSIALVADTLYNDV